MLVRLQPEDLAALDEWIDQDGARFSRPEALRVLMRHALGKTVGSRGVQMLEPRLKELPPGIPEGRPDEEP